MPEKLWHRHYSVDCRDLIPRICHVILPLQVEPGSNKTTGLQADSSLPH